MTNTANNQNEPERLTDNDLEEVSGGIISYSIRDLVNLLPEPTRTIVINKNDHTEQGEWDFLAALESELYINGHDHEGELVSYYYWHHWEPIDSQYPDPNFSH